MIVTEKFNLIEDFYYKKPHTYFKYRHSVNMIKAHNAHILKENDKDIFNFLKNLNIANRPVLLNSFYYRDKKESIIYVYMNDNVQFQIHKYITGRGELMYSFKEVNFINNMGPRRITHHSNIYSSLELDAIYNIMKRLIHNMIRKNQITSIEIIDKTKFNFAKETRRFSKILGKA